MKLNYLLGAIAAVALPIATLSSCNDDGKDAAGSQSASAEAKYHYAVAMTGVV